MKRLVILLFIIPSFQVAGFSQLHPLVAEQGYADSILVNGKIVTMDDWSTVPNTPGTIVESMAIKGERIMALGTKEEMREVAGPNTRFIDMGNRTVIPGIINPHFHAFSGAARTYGPSQGLTDPSIQLRLVGETTAEATAKKIRDTVVNAIRVQNIPPGQWITVGLTDNKANPSGTARGWL